MSTVLSKIVLLPNPDVPGPNDPVSNVEVAGFASNKSAPIPPLAEKSIEALVPWPNPPDDPNADPVVLCCGCPSADVFLALDPNNPVLISPELRTWRMESYMYLDLLLVDQKLMMFQMLSS